MLGDEAPAYSGRLAKLVGVATTANVPGNCVAAFRSRSSSVVRAAKSGNLSSRCTMPLLGLLGAFAGDLLATSLSDPARCTSHGRVLTTYDPIQCCRQWSHSRASSASSTSRRSSPISRPICTLYPIVCTADCKSVTASTRSFRQLTVHFGWRSSHLT